jgi:hypothetical protein
LQRKSVKHEAVDNIRRSRRVFPVDCGKWEDGRRLVAVDPKPKAPRCWFWCRIHFVRGAFVEVLA